MAKVYIIYDEWVEDLSGEDDSSYEKSVNVTFRQYEKSVDVTFRHLRKAPPEDRMFYDSIDVQDGLEKLDHLYVVVFRYSDGDTFGSTSGLWYIGGAFETPAQAEEVRQRLNSDKSGTYPWNTYFASLGYSEVIRLDLW